MESKNTFVKVSRFWRMGQRHMEPVPVDLVVEYGMHYIQGNSMPYFAITTQGGCMHNEVKKIFPELAELIRYHLVDQNGQPMHYIANAMYWYELATGMRIPERFHTQSYLDILREHIIAETSEEMFLQLFIAKGEAVQGNKEREDREKGKFRKWLEGRTVALEARFKDVMARFNVNLINMDE